MDINKFLGILLIIAVFVFLAMWISSSRNNNDRVKTKIDNRIVGYDPSTGAYLVQAPNTRAITGVNTHVDGNLPMHILGYDKGLFVVDPTGAYRRSRHTNWQKLDGEYEILPRGATKTAGHIADQVVGWDHNYIHKIGTPYPGEENRR